MKITEVEPIILRLPSVELRADGTQDAFVLRIHTDEGFVGVGEADTAPLVARAFVEMPASHSLQQGIRDLLLGRDPLDVEAIWHDLYLATIHHGHRGAGIHVLSAVDIALHDLAGKALGQPVHRLLGGAHRDRVRVYASMLMPETPEQARQATTASREAGYSAVKLGWGPLGRDAELDVALVRAAREGIGEAADLMIDAGRVWTWRQALTMARRFEDQRLTWLEEPLPVDDLEGLVHLCEHSPVPIATGEQEATIHPFRALVDAGVDIVQPDLARCGGFTQARRISALTYERNRRLVPHAFSTGILVAASLHLVAAMPHGWLTEFSVADSPFVRDLLQEPFRLEDGHVRVPTGPGLGVELDPEVLERFRVA